MAFELKDMAGIAIAVVVGAVVLGIGATVTADIAADTAGWNATSGACDNAGTDLTSCSATLNGTKGLENMGTKLPLIGTIAALAIVLGIVFSSLMFRQ